MLGPKSADVRSRQCSQWTVLSQFEQVFSHKLETTGLYFFLSARGQISPVKRHVVLIFGAINVFYVHWGETVPMPVEVIDCQSAVSSFSSLSVNIHWVSTEQKQKDLWQIPLLYMVNLPSKDTAPILTCLLETKRDFRRNLKHERVAENPYQVRLCVCYRTTLLKKATNLQLWKRSYTLQLRAGGTNHCGGTGGIDPCHIHHFPSHERPVPTLFSFLKGLKSSPEEAKHIKAAPNNFPSRVVSLLPKKLLALKRAQTLCLNVWPGIWGLQRPPPCVGMSSLKRDDPGWISELLPPVETIPQKAFWSQLSSRRNYLPSWIVKIWKVGQPKALKINRRHTPANFLKWISYFRRWRTV